MEKDKNSEPIKARKKIKPNNQSLITASEIDLKLKTDIIANEFNQYVIKQIRSEQHKQTSDNDNDLIESQTKDYDTLRKKILERDDTKKYKRFLIKNVQSNLEKLLSVRDNLGLNEIPFLEGYIEKNKFQNYDKLFDYNELINQYRKIYENNEAITLFDFIESEYKKEVYNYINSYTDYPLNFKANYNNLFDDSNPLSLVKYLLELYKVGKDIDDIELYDKFNGYNNIDISNLLSDILFKTGYNLIGEINKKYCDDNDRTIIVKKLISPNLMGMLLRNTHIKYTLKNPLFPIVSNNAITCFETMYTNNDNNKKLYVTRTIGEILLMITSPLNKGIKKENRPQIYMTFDGTRPKSTDYHKWNGFQIFDMDLKKFCEDGGDIHKLKNKLYQELTKYRWFLFIVFSSSGKGLHIYTKVAPPINVYITDNKDEKNNIFSQYWYTISYHTKFIIINKFLYSNRYELGFKQSEFVNSVSNDINSGYNELEYNELKYLDNTVGRITSGIRLTYDTNPLINEAFMDLPIQVNLFDENIVDKNYTRKIYDFSSVINQKFVETIDNIIEDYRMLLQSETEGQPIAKTKKVNIDNLVLKGYDVSTYKELPLSKIKYKLRYEVCNTLASLFGKDGLQLAHKILRSKECGNENEINAFYASALRNKKEPSKYGVDILTSCGIVKSVKKELNVELCDKYKLYLKNLLEKNLVKGDKKYQLDLNDDEFLSSRFDYIFKRLIKHDKINLIYAQPAVGKTTLIKDLSKTKRVMLVLPFISVIKNKIEYDKDIMDSFECYYDDKDISKMEYGINVVTTFDKFSRCNHEKIARMFDYIVIDEEHLLFNSQYRIGTTSTAIRNIFKLYHTIANDPFSASVIMMTGTPTGSSFFFSDISNVIKVNKRLKDKSIEFHICDDLLDATTRLSYKISEKIRNGYKIIIPTNKGDIYVEKIIGMVEYLLEDLGRPIKYGYYKRSNIEQEICKIINEQNSVGDYDIIFCSNYLSVGIDINDDVDFAVFYLGQWSAYEIEQFNSRIRLQDIESYYFIQTLTNEGKFNELLYEIPTLQLKLTEDDVQNFVDDKSIAGKKEEFIAQYDPVLHTISTPGFIIFGKQIKFDREQYELINFENKYNECFQHPLKIADILYDYGYNVIVSTEFEGLSNELQMTLKEVGIISAKEERLNKNRELYGTIIDLIQFNDYKSESTGLEFHNVIEHISKNRYDIVEDRDLDVTDNQYVKIIYNHFSQPEKIIVKSKVALDKVLSTVRYLISRYSKNTALRIVEKYVRDDSIFVYNKFVRAINLTKILDAHTNNDLTPAVENSIEKIYEFVDLFEMDKNMSVKYTKYIEFVDLLTNDYIDYLGINIKTKYGWDKLRETMNSLFSDICIRKTVGKGMVRFEYNKLPEQDNIEIINKKSIDLLIEKIFSITETVVKNDKLDIKRHLIKFVDQPF